MTNNMLFIANWKMFGDLKAVNSAKKVIKFSKSKTKCMHFCQLRKHHANYQAYSSFML